MVKKWHATAYFFWFFLYFFIHYAIDVFALVSCLFIVGGKQKVGLEGILLPSPPLLKIEPNTSI
jgi:hypothetical protein